MNENQFEEACEQQREREQQESEEHLYYVTRQALLEAARFLSEDQMDILMYHCGFTDEDLI